MLQYAGTWVRLALRTAKFTGKKERKPCLFLYAKVRTQAFLFSFSPYGALFALGMSNTHANITELVMQILGEKKFLKNVLNIFFFFL